MQLVPRLQAYGSRAIQNHKAHVASARFMTTTTFFDKCLNTDKKQSLTDFEIACESGNFIIAGSDTTAVSLTYIIYSLLLPVYAASRATLLPEIESVPSNASPTVLSALPYLRAVIEEGLLLFGAAPASLPRTVPPAGATLGGYCFPAGTVASTQAYTMHRDPTIFDNPER